MTHAMFPATPAPQLGRQSGFDATGPRRDWTCGWPCCQTLRRPISACPVNSKSVTDAQGTEQLLSMPAPAPVLASQKHPSLLTFEGARPVIFLNPHRQKKACLLTLPVFFHAILPSVEAKRAAAQQMPPCAVSARPAPAPGAVARRAVLASLTSVGIPVGGAKDAPLAPLGPTNEEFGGPKSRGLPIEAVRDALGRGLGEDEYFVTGKMPFEVFSGSCRFVDPTNDVTGLSKYARALEILFDPDLSGVRLLSIAVTSPRTVEATWELGGFLRKEFFFWRPVVKPFEGKVVWTVGDDGLVVEQREEWSISPWEALRETFTPYFGEPYKVL